MEVSESSTEIVADNQNKEPVSVKLREKKKEKDSRKTGNKAARISIAGAATQIRSPAAMPVPVITPKVVIEEVECGIGEYSKLGKMYPCDQKQLGVKWANPGKDCKISECISDEYVLVDKDKEQPQCLQICNV